MYVRVHVYVHVHVHVYVRVRVYVHVRVCVCMSLRSCVCARVYVHVCAISHACGPAGELWSAGAARPPWTATQTRAPRINRVK